MGLSFGDLPRTNHQAQPPNQPLTKLDLSVDYFSHAAAAADGRLGTSWRGSCGVAPVDHGGVAAYSLNPT